jgi:predicted MFS family arabinose efflux permease
LTKATTAGDRRFLTGGAIVLAVAMGVGRFAYTPLLPVMERDAGLTVSTAGALASANLFGYLVGALLAMHPITHGRRLAIMRWSIAGVVVTTALMVSIAPLWLPLRFITGICSGLVFVFASSIVLDRAARDAKPAWPPLFYSGVGFGIAFSGVAVPAFVAYGGSKVAWAGIAIVSALALLVTVRWFTDDAPPKSVARGSLEAPLSNYRATFVWLLAIYMAEAFAYIIPATFLVAIVARIPELSHYAALSWVVVGLAAAFATFPWIHAAARLGKGRALAVALALQAIGVAIPAFSRTPLAVVFSAAALGGTFMAIAFFAAGLGRDMFPHRTASAVSQLTALYGIGQIVGPLVATHLALRFGSYDPALIGAGAVAAVAAIATLLTVASPRNNRQLT